MAIITVFVSGAYDKINAQCVGTGCETVYLPDYYGIPACKCPGRDIVRDKKGKLKRFTLAESWRTPGGGAIFKGGTEIEFGEIGIPKRFTFVENFKFPDGSAAKGGTEIEYCENGKLKRYILAENWKSPATGIVYKGGTAFECYENGKIKRFTLAENFKFPDGSAAKGGTVVEYYENGKPKRATLAIDSKTPHNGFSLKGGKEFEYYENGNFKRFTLAKDWTGPGGVVYKGGIEYNFERVTSADVNNWENYHGNTPLTLQDKQKIHNEMEENQKRIDRERIERDVQWGFRNPITHDPTFR